MFCSLRVTEKSAPGPDLLILRLFITASDLITDQIQDFFLDIWNVRVQYEANPSFRFLERKKYRNLIFLQKKEVVGIR